MNRRRLKTLTPALLLLVSLGLLSASAWSRGESPSGAAALETAGLAGRLINGLASRVEGVWRGYFGLVGLQTENERLRQTLERQSSLIIQLAEERAANERLRRLLEFRKSSPRRWRAAKVVAWDPSPWFRSVIIDVGAADGLLDDSAVVSDRGVVGRVVETAPHFAKVLLLTDASSGIDAFVQRTRLNGLLSGRGRDAMSLDYVRKADDVRPGDLVVTSGLDGVFPPGLALGSVALVDKNSLGLFIEAQVRPMVDLGALEEVLVLLDREPPLDWLALGSDLRRLFEKKQH
ncbi:MAG: rod shape-determining protein MreC [Deltaproteobacteria bacterium]|jgi:rod shape-determining protein MreC|nr:rod shape-determining protein MreC [Deltaproteobacteria bacterium]